MGDNSNKYLVFISSGTSQMDPLFSNRLSTLLESVKGIFSKKSWSLLLGVSQPAISQWTNGKTVPESSKLRSILDLLQTHEPNLSVNQIEELNRFRAILEYDFDDVGARKPSRAEYSKISDYILKDVEFDFRNQIKHLHYELKYELYNHFSKHSEIILDKLIDHLDCRIENDSFQARYRELDKLKIAFSDVGSIDKCNVYVSRIRETHNLFNKLFSYLIENSSSVNDFRIPDFHSVISKIFGEKKSALESNLLMKYLPSGTGVSSLKDHLVCYSYKMLLHHINHLGNRFYDLDNRQKEWVNTMLAQINGSKFGVHGDDSSFFLFIEPFYFKLIDQQIICILEDKNVYLTSQQIGSILHERHFSEINIDYVVELVNLRVKKLEENQSIRSIIPSGYSDKFWISSKWQISTEFIKGNYGFSKKLLQRKSSIKDFINNCTFFHNNGNEITPDIVDFFSEFDDSLEKTEIRSYHILSNAIWNTHRVSKYVFFIIDWNRNRDLVDGINNTRNNFLLEYGYLLGKYGRENVFILNRNQTVSNPLFCESLFCDQMDLEGAWKRKIANVIKQLGFEVTINEKNRQKWRKLFDGNYNVRGSNVFVKNAALRVIDDVVISCDPENSEIAQNIARELERLGITSDFLPGSQNDEDYFINEVIDPDKGLEFNRCCLMLFGENRAKLWSNCIENIEAANMVSKSKMSKFIFIPTDEACVHFRRVNDVLLKNNYVLWRDNPAAIAEDLKRRIEYYKSKGFAHVNGFSPFELKIIHFMCHGEESVGIAQKLSLKQGIVDKCVAEIKNKSQTKTVADLKKYIFKNDISI